VPGRTIENLEMIVKHKPRFVNPVSIWIRRASQKLRATNFLSITPCHRWLSLDSSRDTLTHTPCATNSRTAV